MFARLRYRRKGSVDDAQSGSQNDLLWMTCGEWLNAEALSVIEYTRLRKELAMCKVEVKMIC